MQEAADRCVSLTDVSPSPFLFLSEISKQVHVFLRRGPLLQTSRLLSCGTDCLMSLTDGGQGWCCQPAGRRPAQRPAAAKKAGLPGAEPGVSCWLPSALPEAWGSRVP